MASSANERILNRLDKIYDAQGAGGAAFEDITGEPTDNAALGSALSAKVPTSRTVNGQALSGDVVVTGLMLDTAGAPDNGIGANGDYAFDDATKTIYGPKAGGVWPAGVVLGATATGGVIGTARFVPGSLPAVEYVTGVIASILTDGSGSYVLTFGSAQPDTNYNVIPVAIDTTLVVVAQPSAKAVGTTNVLVRRTSDGAAFDPEFVEVTVTRLSQ